MDTNVLIDGNVRLMYHVQRCFCIVTLKDEYSVHHWLWNNSCITISCSNVQRIAALTTFSISTTLYLPNPLAASEYHITLATVLTMPSLLVVSALRSMSASSLYHLVIIDVTYILIRHYHHEQYQHNWLESQYAQDFGKSRPNVQPFFDGLDPGSNFDAVDSYSKS